jgi:hypothetical protein
VRGRVDHKEAGRTSLVAQEVSPFRPTAAEVTAAREAATREPEPVTVPIIAVDHAMSIINDLKHYIENHRGECEVVLRIETSSGERYLRFGEDYRVERIEGLHTELTRILARSATAGPAVSAN